MKDFKIIISPSKTFNHNADSYIHGRRPKYIDVAKDIFSHIKEFDLDKTKIMYKISDKKSIEVFNMHQAHGQKLYPAINLYYGTVFKELQLDMIDMKWANEHLLILDALYGLIKPMDLIAPYRLDFHINFPLDLKSIWKQKINNELNGFNIINLASKEFSKLIEHKMITPHIDNKFIKKNRGIVLNKILINKEYK